MHIPSTFKESDTEILLNVMRENAFATIVTTDEIGRPVATPLPFLVDHQNGITTLRAHFAKANPQWKHLENNNNILVIFNGPHCYISPSWYKNTGVPTWNYVSIHAYGSAVLCSTENTVELIEELSDRYEEFQEKPWKAENNYSEKMLNHIVGFEIKVSKLQGKFKLSQNKSSEDQHRVIKALSKSSSEQDRYIAESLKRFIDKR